MIKILMKIRAKITIIVVENREPDYFIYICKCKEVPLSIFYQMLASTMTTDERSIYYKVYGLDSAYPEILRIFLRLGLAGVTHELITIRNSNCVTSSQFYKIVYTYFSDIPQRIRFPWGPKLLHTVLILMHAAAKVQKWYNKKKLIQYKNHNQVSNRTSSFKWCGKWKENTL